MRNINFLAMTLFAVCLTAFTGCGDSTIAPVAGTVTFEDQPVPNLRVNFSPEPVGENFAPGPISSGKTDADGKFSLKTRYGDSGAFVGKHKLTFDFTDISPTKMDSLYEQMLDAQGVGNKKKAAEVKKKINALKKKLEERPDIKQQFKIITVPSGGEKDLKLEFTEIVQE